MQHIVFSLYCMGLINRLSTVKIPDYLKPSHIQMVCLSFSLKPDVYVIFLKNVYKCMCVCVHIDTDTWQQPYEEFKVLYLDC